VNFLRLDVRDLLPQLRAELMVMLGTLSGEEWDMPTACPAWSVHGVASHLLGVEIGNVSIRRDRWGLGPGPGDDLDVWLDAFNQQWVDAARRISPAVLIELIGVTGRRFEEHVAALDIDAIGGPVEWATGERPAPVWLDVAREYMERFVHQSQIRAACQRPPLPSRFARPVIRTAVHALPLALAGTSRPAGTTVSFIVGDDPGTGWELTYTEDGWELGPLTAGGPHACEIRTTLDGAIRSFVRDPTAPAFAWKGDRQLAEAVSHAKAILGR
jgi:uncharacterized protein (TIGR03083 family)